MIIGIDPGLSGAVCVLSESGEGHYRVCLLEDLPTVTFSAGRTKNRVDGALLSGILRDYVGARLAVVERVSSRPGEGVSSAFSFGYTSGVIHGVLGALKIPVITPTPVTWKSSMKLGKDKDMSRAMALEMFPSQSDKLKRKMDHNRAEALLLAVWGSRQS